MQPTITFPGALKLIMWLTGEKAKQYRSKMVVCEQNSKRAWATWDNLSEERKKELSPKLGKIKFDGRGEREQPGVTFDGALTLMNWLPGEKAKTWRRKATHILKRYFAGDPTLLDDIQANAASNAHLHQAARAAMNNPEPAPGQDRIPLRSPRPKSSTT